LIGNGGRALDDNKSLSHDFEEVVVDNTPFFVWHIVAIEQFCYETKRIGTIPKIRKS
jgi:hypothetical protein